MDRYLFLRRCTHPDPSQQVEMKDVTVNLVRQGLCTSEDWWMSADTAKV